MLLDVQGRTAYAYTGGRPFDPQAPAGVVVLVHGALNDHSVWTLLARWLAHYGHAVLAVDLPGHRRSAGPALDSIEAMADWLLALLDASGVERAVLGGHSMGSLVALQAASRAPGRCRALWMFGTAYPMKVSPALLQGALDEPQATIDRVVTWSHSTLAPKPAYPGPGTWVRGGARALMQGVLAAQGDARLFHTDFAACQAYQGGDAAADRVQTPVDFFLGTADAMTPAKAALALATRLRAEVHRVPAGHALMAEAPEAVLTAVRLALGRLAGHERRAVETTLGPG